MKYWWTGLACGAMGIFAINGLASLNEPGKASWYAMVMLLMAVLCIPLVVLGWREHRDTFVAFIPTSIILAILMSTTNQAFVIVQATFAVFLFLFSLTAWVKRPDDRATNVYSKIPPQRQHPFLSHAGLKWFWVSLALACGVFLCLDAAAVQNPALPDKVTANLMIIGGVFAIALAAGYVGWVFPRRAGTSFVVLAVLLVILAINLGPFEVPSLQAWQSWSSLGLFILSLFGSVTVVRELPGASEHAANSSLKT